MKTIISNCLSLIAVLFIYLTLVLSNRLGWITPINLLYFPIEIFIIAGLLLIPLSGSAILRGILGCLLAVGLIFRIADISAFQIFSRSFNPVFDAYLLPHGFRFLESNFGVISAVLASLVLVVLVIAIFVVFYWALGRMQRILCLSSKRSLIVGVPLAALWVGLHLSGWPRTSTWFIDQFAGHVQRISDSVGDLREFRQVVDSDPYADVAGDQLFQILANKDVLVVFIESYGRTVLTKDEYALEVIATLNEATRSLDELGYASRSALLTSPTVGGISWLAHGTALSGLWIDSQVRYDSLLLSERETLLSLFGRAGWHTVGLMPAISMAWPEGIYFGYDSLLSARELDYQGKPFNYVTMPDQFTLARFQALERTSGVRKPVMAEIALLSSHAPWTPIPHLIEWDDVGDGSEFNAQATAGDPPEVVWQDKQRVMRQYRESIEYVINTLVSYTQTYGNDDLVMLILGDHQPMPYVTDDDPSRDVPVHIIASDPAVMAAIDQWGWNKGMLPSLSGPVWRMDALRDEFIRAFSHEPESSLVEPQPQ